MTAAERNSPPWQLLKAWQQGQALLAPVATLLKIEPLEFSEEFARIGIPVGATYHNPFGTVHGGLLCAFADVAMGIALATVLEMTVELLQDAKGFDRCASPDDNARFAPVAFRDTDAHRGSQAS